MMSIDSVVEGGATVWIGQRTAAWFKHYILGCSLVLASAVLCLAACATQARTEDIIPAIKGLSREQYLKRIKSLDAKSIAAWSDTLKTTTGESPTSFQSFDMLPYFDKLWKDDVFQSGASEFYTKRAQGVPADAIREWRAAIKRKYPDTSDDQPLSNALLRMLTIEQLFNGTTFKGDV